MPDEHASGEHASNHDSPPAGFVRLASAADAGAIAGVQMAAWREAFDGIWSAEIFEALEATDVEMQWARAVISPPGPAFRVLVATEAEVVIGFCAIAPSEDGDAEASEMELVAWEVAPQARGRGNGTRLLTAAVDHARQLGAASLNVWTLATDDGKLGLLRESGFAPDGAHREMGIDDGWADEGPAPILRQVRLVAGI